jgi:hypothetical protein
VLNDALSIYFADATLASAFVARWCVGPRWRQREACSKCAKMSRRRGSERDCTGRCEAERVRPCTSRRSRLSGWEWFSDGGVLQL